MNSIFDLILVLCALWDRLRVVRSTLCSVDIVLLAGLAGELSADFCVLFCCFLLHSATNLRNSSISPVAFSILFSVWEMIAANSFTLGIRIEPRPLPHHMVWR